MTEPQRTPQERARHLRESFDRWEDGLSTIEITKPPSKAQPIPIEPAFIDPDDEEDEVS